MQVERHGITKHVLEDIKAPSPSREVMHGFNYC